MTELLSGIKGMICYFDDILMHNPSTEEHKRLIAKVEERLKEVGLLLDRKCEYFKKEIHFLGYIVSENGVRPDPVKVEAIQKMAATTNVTELRRFLGMKNFLDRYLPSLSTIIRPISETLEKEKSWIWGEPQETTFGKAKELVTATSTLAFFDATKLPFFSSDASSNGVGDVLLQEHDRTWRPRSKLLTHTDCR